MEEHQALLRPCSHRLPRANCEMHKLTWNSKSFRGSELGSGHLASRLAHLRGEAKTTRERGQHGHSATCTSLRMLKSISSAVSAHLFTRQLQHATRQLQHVIKHVQHATKHVRHAGKPGGGGNTPPRGFGEAAGLPTTGLPVGCIPLPGTSPML